MFFPCSYALSAEPSLAQQASLAWAQRDQAGKTEEAIRLWSEATKTEPQVADHWINLTKALGRAVRHATSNKQELLWADQAKQAAEKAVTLDPLNSQAYAYYGEALGQSANARKNLRSLSAVKKAVEVLNKAVTLNPSNAYAHMLLAEFYRQSPRVVSIGDKAKAMEHARLAVQHGPAYAINHLVLARSLLDQGQKDEAIRELRVIQGLVAPSDAIPETKADQETAKSMLEMLVSSSNATPCDHAHNACTE